MSQRLHYLITLITMLVLGIIITKPHFLIPSEVNDIEECRILREGAKCQD